MDKLTLEHLTPYLPYGLKVKLSDEGRFYLDSEYPNEHQHKEGIITHFTTADDGIYGEFKVSDRYYFSFNELSEITLCLRPLSDLTKEIEHNGERFVPVDVFCPHADYENEFDRKVAVTALELAGALNFKYSPYLIVQKLFKWHFDVFGLIDAGLAIDINTIKI